MRNKTSLFKRSLAAVLCLVLVLGLIPVLGGGKIALKAEAAPVDTTGNPVGDYITLPITIRDFTTDGMLFEYNEVDSSDTKYIGGTSTNIDIDINTTVANNNYSTEYAYVIEYSYATSMNVGGNEWWHDIYVNADGTINRVYPKGTAVEDPSIPVDGMVISAYEGCVNYSYFSNITNENKTKFTFSVAAHPTYSGYYIVVATKYDTVYRQADTKGFGLMLTGNNDRIQDLTTTSGPGAYIGNGTYGVATVPDPIDITLNSGATQKGYGITIRKDLVGPTLVNGKPAYTEDTVTYLANYMSQIMNEPWQNADGSYNTFFVMGTKMFDDAETYVGPNDPNATLDLAQLLRNHVTSLGDYDTTIAKVKAGGLKYPVQCETWFDAAYYLLHNTWQDSPIESSMAPGTDGYGKYVPEYHSLHLVAKTQDDGSVYYVFNSGYNDTAYNPASGEIFNTQTENITAAQNSSGDFYTRGIKLPAARFDPLGPSGTSSTANEQWLGYGPNTSSNTYGDLTGASATQLWDEYYDTTNYHLSLEGHAEFVFHYDSNLYFTFTGDDDVYLYINGIRVLDLGAAHSIVKAQISLNDVAELCGLKEGEPASFDFFYMERHGTAANFGIETNIQLAQSGMITSKEGYQNGTTTGYNGPVDPSKPVAYSFTLKNNGDATLEHLTFTDPKLGVSLSEYNIDLGSKLESTLADMYLYIRDENDAIVRFYSATTTPALTEDVLMKELEDGLPKGHSMTIYNFRYKITDWADDETFTNVVNTTAISNGKQLAGTADWKVRKAELVTDPFHIYNWVYKDLDDTEWQTRDIGLTKAELVQPVLVAKPGHDVSKADIVMCNASGNTNANLWSQDYTNVIKNVTLGTDDSIVYNSKKPGMETIYYKILNIGYDNRVYHFDVITYGVADNVYVLDYGLNVELNCDQYGFRVNDHLTVPQNIHAPNTSIYIRPQESNYGDFVFTHKQDKDENGAVVKDYGIDPISASVQYVPDDFMSGADSFKAEIVICEPGKALSKFTGVTMEEYVITAPANVVYYEENFPGITYVSEGENQWIHYETIGDVVNENGETVQGSTAGTNQSPDQDLNYGSDPNYAEDKVGVLEADGPVENTISLNLDASDLNAVQKLGISALNTYFGLGGGDSNGTVNKLEVKQTATVMYFDFVGTGLELISRTTRDEYAVINVQVQKKNADGSYTVVKQLPVITESKGGDLYQIPVISITGLPRDSYHVVIQAGTTGEVNRVFYVDGIRIYGPLEGTDLDLEYYNPAEYQAEFFEIKQLIEDGDMFYADLGIIDNDFQFGGGSTMVEDTEGITVLVPVEDPYDYMSIGPNNELYMDGNNVISVLPFIITPVENYPNSARTLQIGAHRKANSGNEDMGAAVLTYGSDAQEIFERSEQYLNEFIVDGTNSYSIASGTEMYYTIDVDNLIQQADGSYLVMIAAIGSEANGTNLALTNLKVAGYTITNAETTLLEAAEEGTVDELPLVQQTFGLLRAVRDLIAAEPEVEEIPVNENLTITAAKLTATKVVTGRTATLTVKSGEEAQTLVLVDSQGNEVTPTKCTRKVSRGVVTFTYIWKVTGSSGQTLNYSVRLYDADGLASVNTESVTVTIR